MWKKFGFSKMAGHNHKDRVICKKCSCLFDNDVDHIVHVKHVYVSTALCLDCYKLYKPTKLSKGNVCQKK